jgi:hypothetical protein
MAAWVGVFDHPFFAVTDEKGRFEIQGLPPGKYTVAVWHEKLESIEREVDLAAGDSKERGMELGELKD